MVGPNTNFRLKLRTVRGRQYHSLPLRTGVGNSNALTFSDDVLWGPDPNGVNLKQGGFNVVYSRNLAVLFVGILLSGCSGILAYENGGQVTVGSLDDTNINAMNASYDLVSTGSYDDLVYAVDAAGENVGVCRTDFENRKMRLGVYNITTRGDGRSVWGLRHNISDNALAIDIDQNPDTNFDYSDLMSNDRLDMYFHCFAMSAGPSDQTLIIHIQPQSKSELAAMNIALLLDVSGGQPKVPEVELWERTSQPTSLSLRDNSLNGNTVSIQQGRIQVNGSPVRLNGQPVPADSVKHHFQ